MALQPNSVIVFGILLLPVTSVSEDMNSGLRRTNPAYGQGPGGNKTLDQTMQLRHSNRSVTLPHSLQYLRSSLIVNWQTAGLLFGLLSEALQCTIVVPQKNSFPFSWSHLIVKFPLLLSLNCGGFHLTIVFICVAVIFWSGGQYKTSGPELSVNTTLIYVRQVSRIYGLNNRNHYCKTNFLER